MDGFLTKQQQNFFDTFGYVVLKSLFKPEIEKISERFDTIFQEYQDEAVHWQHRAHGYGYRDFIYQFIDRDPYLSSLLDDGRINNLFKSLLGDDYSYRGSDGNIFETNTKWHSDTYGAILTDRNVKLAFYLEPLNAMNGALRILPGSHLFGDKFANKMQASVKKDDSLKDTLGLEDHEVPAQIICTEPGDVIAFDFRVKHATCFAVNNRRRMFTICAAERIKEPDVPRLRELIKRSIDFGVKSYYGEAVVRTATPERMRHLAQCLEHESSLFEK